MIWVWRVAGVLAVLVFLLAIAIVVVGGRDDDRYVH